MKTKNALAMVVAVAGLAGCSTPLSLRGARVLEPGEVEVLVSPQAQLGYAPQGLVQSSTRLYPLAWGELSGRFGIAERMDLQLRIDPSIIPEVSVGYQLLGDPARNDDLALTLTGGLKLAPAALAFGAGYANLPLQVLVEAPVNDVVAFTAGVRVIPNLLALFNGSGGVGFGIAPGLVGGIRVKLGAFVLQPELGLSGNFPIAGVDASGINEYVGIQNVAATFGLNFGGQFDFRTPAPAPPPAANALPALEPIEPTPIEPTPPTTTAPPAPVEAAPIEGTPTIPTDPSGG